MDLGRKRIVYFVVEEVAALFADGNELAYRIVFFFETDYSHKFLPLSDRDGARNFLGRAQTLYFHETHKQAGA
jgi:hypothetical protein